MLQVDIGVQIVYFIVAADLKQLHDEYDVNYEALMTSSAQAALKVRYAKVSFSVELFIRIS